MSEESPLPNRRGPSCARQSFIVVLSFLSVTLISLVVPASAWANGSSPHVTSASPQRFDNPVAITAHGKYVWVADDSGGAQHHGALYRIDIANGQTLPIINSLFDSPLWMYTNGVDIWIANQFGNPAHSLLQLNIATNQLSRVASKGVNGPVDMTSQGKYLWLLNANGGSSVTRMNIATGAFTTNDAVVTAGENSITSDKSYVWVAGARLLRISEATNKVKVIEPNHFTNTSEIVSYGNDLWFRSGNRHLIEMDKTSGKIRSFYNPAFEFSLNLTTNGHFVWMADSENRSVVQFNAATGKVTEINSPDFLSRTVQLTPFSITSEGTNVWVSVLCDKVVDYKTVACAMVDEVRP